MLYCILIWPINSMLMPAPLFHFVERSLERGVAGIAKRKSFQIWRSSNAPKMQTWYLWEKCSCDCGFEKGAPARCVSLRNVLRSFAGESDGGHSRLVKLVALKMFRWTKWYAACRVPSKTQRLFVEFLEEDLEYWKANAERPGSFKPCMSSKDKKTLKTLDIRP